MDGLAQMLETYNPMSQSCTGSGLTLLLLLLLLLLPLKA